MIDPRAGTTIFVQELEEIDAVAKQEFSKLYTMLTDTEASHVLDILESRQG
jgi:hypothetical protein